MRARNRTRPCISFSSTILPLPSRLMHCTETHFRRVRKKKWRGNASRCYIPRHRCGQMLCKQRVQHAILSPSSVTQTGHDHFAAIIHRREHLCAPPSTIFSASPAPGALHARFEKCFIAPIFPAPSIRRWETILLDIFYLPVSPPFPRICSASAPFSDESRFGSLVSINWNEIEYECKLNTLNKLFINIV